MSTFRAFGALLQAGAAVAATTALAACSIGPVSPATTASIVPAPAAQPAARKSEAVKIALLLPFSAQGEPAEIARAMKQAAEIAMFDANDPAVQLIARDDGGTPDGAVRAAATAISDGAEIVLGPLFGTSVTASAPVARKAGVPIIAFSNDPAVAGNGVYLMSFLASLEVDRIVTFAASKGKRRFAALIPQSAYGHTVEPAFRKSVAGAGGELVRLETYSPDTTAMLAAAKRIVAAIADAEKSGNPIDALFVPAGADTISQLGPLLTYAGIGNQKVKLIGTSIWDIPAISRPDALIGGWFAAPDPSAVAQFANKFRMSFGNDPPRLALLAYDAMTVALSLSKGPKGERFSPLNLTRAEGFAGVDGSVRLYANGLSDRGLSVLEIEKYRSVVIDAAPQSPTGNVSATAALPKFF